MNGIVKDWVSVMKWVSGVEENETEAFKYYTLAADNGNTTSMYRTGLCYYNG